jgi:hypothetical protein
MALIFNISLVRNDTVNEILVTDKIHTEITRIWREECEGAVDYFEKRILDD